MNMINFSNITQFIKRNAVEAAAGIFVSLSFFVHEMRAVDAPLLNTLQIKALHLLTIEVGRIFFALPKNDLNEEQRNYVQIPQGSTFFFAAMAYFYLSSQYFLIFLSSSIALGSIYSLKKAEESLTLAQVEPQVKEPALSNQQLSWVKDTMQAFQFHVLNQVSSERASLTRLQQKEVAEEYASLINSTSVDFDKRINDFDRFVAEIVFLEPLIWKLYRLKKSLDSDETPTSNLSMLEYNRARDLALKSRFSALDSKVNLLKQMQEEDAPPLSIQYPYFHNFEADLRDSLNKYEITANARIDNEEIATELLALVESNASEEGISSWYATLQQVYRYSNDSINLTRFKLECNEINTEFQDIDSDLINLETRLENYINPDIEYEDQKPPLDRF